MNSLLLLALFPLLASCQEAVVTDIAVKTGTADDASMTLGSVDVTISCNPSRPLDSCTAQEIDGQGNDFQSGDVNYFEVSDVN